MSFLHLLCHDVTSMTSMKFEKFNIKFFCVVLGLVGFVFPAVLGLSFFIGFGFKKT